LGRLSGSTTRRPRLRWRAEDVENAIADELATLRIEPQEVRDLLHESLDAAFEDVSSQQRRQAAALAMRHSELTAMQDRLLNAYLAGTVEEGQYRATTEELRSELAGVTEPRDRIAQIDPGAIEMAFTVFDWRQNADEQWRRSNSALRRRILDSVSLKRTRSDAAFVSQRESPWTFSPKGSF
jgi:hypothetical protein